MSPRKGIVLNANILLRAVFGIRVRQILEAYEDAVAFYSPEVCFTEAEKYIIEVAKRKGLDSKLAKSILEHVSLIVQPVDKSLYEDHEKLARERIERRDPRLRSNGMRPEYDFSKLEGGVRGKYLTRYRAGTNLVLLSPDVAAHFPNEKAVNAALRALIQETKGPRRRAR